MTSHLLPRPITADHIQTALADGDRRLAHDLSEMLLTADPGNEQAWQWYVDTADTPDEVVARISTALSQDPHNPVLRQVLHQAMDGLLRHDAFLGYVDETGQVYYVATAQRVRFAHPKDRAPVEAFPPSSPRPEQAVFRWLGWCLLGLLPAGLGTLVCAPVAMLLALRLLRRARTPADRTRALVAAGAAASLWLLAVFFTILVIAHV